jgi:hypothetical protein
MYHGTKVLKDYVLVPTNGMIADESWRGRSAASHTGVAGLAIMGTQQVGAVIHYLATNSGKSAHAGYQKPLCADTVQSV